MKIWGEKTNKKKNKGKEIKPKDRSTRHHTSKKKKGEGTE